ncbi:3-oxoacyl-[acyl-carrier-protein] synthase III C-terminal domain-containing protein [Streptomyces sp. NPDC058486]|uniref:3-oxoacyl-[acyl-carrier-protein] synthase III C-terminal domain-containing protein n=1 Tax=unclassified Streptomyces TaxID=2593676 RepID=UPI00364B73BD
MTMTSTPSQAGSTGIGLGGLGYAIGDSLPIEKAVPEDTPAELLDKLRAHGFVHCSVAQETPAGLAARSVAESLAVSGVDPARVDAVLYGTCSYWGEGQPPPGDPAALTRTLARVVLEPLGLGHAVLSLVGLAESGNTGSVLRLAQALVAAGVHRTVLCVSSDAVPPLPGEYRAMPNAVTVNGDGAASCLVSSEFPGEFRLDSTVQHSSAAMRGLVKGEGLRKHLEIVKGVRACRAALDTPPGGFARMVSNHYSAPVLAEFAALADVAPERLHTANIARLGHCFAADTLIDLADLHREGLIGPGEAVLMLTTGPSTWGMTAVRAR